MRDPEDTIPPPPSVPSEPRPPPAPVTLEELGALLVDEHALSLAQSCAGWALRGYAIEDLVGVVHDCACTTKVFPRAELSRKYPAGTKVREVLARTQSRPGRLTVAALAQEGCPTYHASIPPGVKGRDTRGLLQPLSAARREWLESCVDRAGHFFRRSIEKEVLSTGRRIDDTLVLVNRIDCDSWRAWPEGDVSIREHDSFTEAARFEAIPYQVLVLFAPEGHEGYAAAWVAPERLGFQGADMDRLICRGRRKYYPNVREVGHVGLAAPVAPAAAARDRRSR